MDDKAAKSTSTANLAFGLPGAADSLTLDEIRAHLARIPGDAGRDAARST